MAKARVKVVTRTIRLLVITEPNQVAPLLYSQNVVLPSLTHQSSFLLQSDHPLQPQNQFRLLIRLLLFHYHVLLFHYHVLLYPFNDYSLYALLHFICDSRIQFLK